MMLADGSWCGSGVGFDGILNPLNEVTYVSVDTWPVRLGTGEITPGHKALQLAIADHRSPGITLLGKNGGTQKGAGM